MVYVELARMKDGQSGKVVRIEGGHGMRARLEGMGIRLGTRITKIRGQIMRGPLIVKAGNTQVAMGFGMARRIMVEVEDWEEK